MEPEVGLLLGAFVPLIFSLMANVYLLLRRRVAIAVHEADIKAITVVADCARKNVVRCLTAR